MTETQPGQITNKVGFVCDCPIVHRLACWDEGFYAEHEGKQYCILHYPEAKDQQRFNSAIERKLNAENYSFSGICFTETASFRGSVFAKNADFSDVIFKGVADFRESQFRGKADFRSATFDGSAEFKATSFQGEAIFSKVNFNGAADFYQVHFLQKADFLFSFFHQDANFTSNEFKAIADFGSAEFQKLSNFYKANFLQKAEFGSAKFFGEARFINAEFQNDGYFAAAEFAGVPDFNTAKFLAAADFSGAIFGGQTRFFSTEFKGETTFSTATFKEMTNFMSSSFRNNADFGSATFHSPVYFDNASFAGEAGFSHTSFKDVARFSSSEKKKVFSDSALLNLEFARIDKPERIAFHGLELRPHWFVNVDCRKFDFLDVRWLNEINWSRTYSPKAELQSLAGKVSAPHRLLSVTYRQLAVNAEENHRYGEALKLRYASMEAHRLETFSGFTPWKLNWWYWLASGYGESAVRAFLVFVALIAVFTFGYTKTCFDHPGKTQPAVGASPSAGNSTVKANDIRPLELKDALIYSLNVAILQKPEPKPFSFAAKLLVWLETVLGPAQAALLALAVRRRFMR